MRFNVSPIYWAPWAYQLTLRLLYGKALDERYRAVSEMIPRNATVLEFCCGDGRLFCDYLRFKSVHYTGVDLLPQMTTPLRRHPVEIIHSDLRSFQPVKADYCVMMGSLYHFHPDEAEILKKMLAAGTGILLEPVHNYASSRRWLTRSLGRLMTYVGGTTSGYRLDDARLSEVLQSAGVQIIHEKPVLGGKYRLVVFGKTSAS